MKFMSIKNISSFWIKSLIVGVSLTFSSCEKILELDPKQSIDSSTALESQDGIESTLISVYSRLQNYQHYGRDMLALAEALSDNAIHTGNSSHLINEAANNRGSHFDLWQNCYYSINEINLVLEALENSAGQYAEGWANDMYGQAYFLRALLYHNLARAYAYDPTAIIQERNKGGVPLMLTAVNDLSKIGELKRASIEDTYKQIYADLEASIASFSGSDEQGLYPYKGNSYAAKALFSRVALYNGDWQKVVDMANDALSNKKSVFSTVVNYVDDWKKETHPESIFELRYNESENIGSDRSLRATYTSRAFYESENFTIQAVIAVNPDFYSLFSEDDVRKGVYRKGVGNNQSYWEVYKFISKNGVMNLDNVPVLRESELYLNRAEAYYHLNQLEDCRDDVNTIRNRAGLDDFETLDAALLDEVLLQRRLELAFEGHRWFDLKRRGEDIIKDSGNLTFDDYRLLAPIPDREVKIDGKLEQNYNY